jgi:hypothetical protein
MFDLTGNIPSSHAQLRAMGLLWLTVAVELNDNEALRFGMTLTKLDCRAVCAIIQTSTKVFCGGMTQYREIVYRRFGGFQAIGAAGSGYYLRASKAVDGNSGPTGNSKVRWRIARAARNQRDFHHHVGLFERCK